MQHLFLNAETLTYKGKLDYDDFLDTVLKMFEKKQYRIRIAENNQFFKEDRRHIEIKLKCMKKKNYYTYIMLILKYDIVLFEELIEEKKESNEHYYQSTINLLIQSYIVTEYEVRAEEIAGITKLLVYVVRNLVQKYIKFIKLDHFKNEVLKDQIEIKQQIREYLKKHEAEQPINIPNYDNTNTNK